MKSLLLSVVFLILIIPQISAQGIDTLHKNYAVNAWLFNGYAASVKFPSQGETYFRILFDLSSSYSGENSSGDQHSYYQNNTSTNNYHYDTARTLFSITISPQVCSNIFSTKHTSIYFGAGFLNYSYNRITSGFINMYYTNASTDRRTISNWASGLDIFLGAQGFLSEDISVFVETHLNGGYSTARNDYGSINNYQTSTGISNERITGWFANLTIIRAGVGIYF